MSQRTGSNFGKITVAAAAMAIAAVPAAMLLSVPASADDTASPHGATAGAPVDAKRIAAGRDLFTSWSCNACHTLSDANASGAVGPSLDGDTSLTEDFIVSRVTNGQGAMPAFGGQLTKEEIANLAYYVTKVSKK